MKSASTLSSRSTSPSNELEARLIRMWQDVLGVRPIGVDADFFDLGGTLEQVTALVDQLQAQLDEYVYTAALFDAPTVQQLAVYLNQHYTAAVRRWLNLPVLPQDTRNGAEPRITLDIVAQFRRLLPSRQPYVFTDSVTPKNPPAIFILCPPRSGSTLLRVMLAGHSQLFSPPELNLLSFNTMGQRRAACTGRYEFMLEGAIRATMALRNIDLDQAAETLAQFEQQDDTTQKFYRAMQEWAHPKTLVDKSTAYALDIETLKQAEANFDDAFYIHLIRHPLGAIRSFEQVRLDRLLLRGRHSYSPRQLAELIWLTGHQNILDFVDQIPATRQHWIYFEELVTDPRPVLAALCDSLGLPFSEEMLQPYRDSAEKMTDGLYMSERMQGDPRFHQHQGINPDIAFSWQADYSERSLSDLTRELALKLGLTIEQASTLELRLPPPEWNQTETPLPDVCLHHLFERQATLTPEAIALVFDNVHLSYRELDDKASLLAGHLQQSGVGPETLVGLHLERSVEMAVALLAILKAGGAYLPLDPAYPPERLSFLLSDSGAALVVSHTTLSDTLPSSKTRVVYIDDLPELAAPPAEAEPAQPDNLAYVIYTSGSTGQPKGVMIPHRGACNVVQAEIEVLGVTSDSRVLQFASLNFDTSVVQIFMALGAGAALYLVSRETLHNSSALLSLMRDEAITHVDLPPSVLGNLPDEGLPSLRVVSTGGERCTPDIVNRWLPGRRFFNCYGTTETSICSLMMECSGVYQKMPPIGYPIANTTAYILDGDMQPVPIGDIGELYLGGVGLGRGYLNHPELTAEKFVLNPFADSDIETVWNSHDSKLYNTGDLARYRPDGAIEFLGRRDHQVKIRGFRIELEEIELSLQQHPAVHETAVVSMIGSSGHQQLVAYVALAETESANKPVDNVGLREFLRQKLPDYMIPSVFVQLPALPRTPANKVDRQALPAPHWDRDTLTASVFESATDPTEQIIEAMWRELLNLNKIGRHDNFFDLGGNSLLLVQAHAQLCETFHQDLPVTDMFRFPTVAALAERLMPNMASEPSVSQIQARIQQKKAHLDRRRRSQK